MSTRGKWTGIYQHGSGWRAMVSRGRNRQKAQRHFPAETPLEEMQAWRADEQARQRLAKRTRAHHGSFAGDAKRYLKLVAGLPTIKDRTREIAVWIGVFEGRQRDRITSGEIRAQRDLWATTPRSDKDERPLAAGTINRRLRALSNLYTVLDGPRAENPVRDVDELREPDPQARALPYETIAAIIEALPDRGRPRKGRKAPKVSESKVRIRCLAYSQITPQQLKVLTPADLDLPNARLRLPARAKGRGAAAVWVPLLPEAVKAFDDFDRLKLYGRFSQRSLRKSWTRAAKKAGASGARPYDLRHTFGTLVYRATGSREAVQQLLQHAEWSTSARYAMGAEDEVRFAHGAAVARHIGTTATGLDRNQADISGLSDRGDRAAEQRSSSKNTRKR